MIVLLDPQMAVVFIYFFLGVSQMPCGNLVGIEVETAPSAGFRLVPGPACEKLQESSQ